MAVLTLLLALIAWLVAPLAPPVPVARAGAFALATAFLVDARPPTTVASPIEAVAQDATTSADGPSCFGVPATIVGRGHLIEGTAGDDAIVARGGPNIVHAGGDQLLGGDGHNQLDGGPGNDGLYDREGHQDDLVGGAGRDFCELHARSSTGCEDIVVAD